jgi:hypothetical protein
MGRRLHSVQAEFLLRVRRARPACALARLDEPSFLCGVRASLPSPCARRAARRRGLARMRGLRVRTLDTARATAARGRARDFELSSDTFGRRAATDAFETGRHRHKACAHLWPRRDCERATDRTRRGGLYLRRAHEEGDALPASRARPLPLLATQRDARDASAVEVDYRGKTVGVKQGQEADGRRYVLPASCSRLLSFRAEAYELASQAFVFL